MKRTIIAAAFASLATLGVALTVVAQSDTLASLLNPLVVTIQQAVPVELTVASALNDGSVITSTVPVTVGVDLAITIQGDQVISVATATDTSSAEVTIAPIVGANDLVDDQNIPYTLEVAEGVEVLSLRSTQPSYDETLQILGEVQNNTDEEQRVEIQITIYDADGRVLEATSTYPKTSPLPGGDKSAFHMITNANVDEISEYRLQIVTN